MTPLTSAAGICGLKKYSVRSDLFSATFSHFVYGYKLAKHTAANLRISLS